MFKEIINRLDSLRQLADCGNDNTIERNGEKATVILLLALVLGTFLLFYRLWDWMPFLGDQGWFYLSARNIWTQHSFPLVGIESSHPWLHQGPLWTYILAILLIIGKFNPLFPGFVTAFIGLINIYLIYKIGCVYFSKNTGAIASLLYATSPLIITTARMPYHTTLIPFFTLIYMYALYKWISGNAKYFPLITFLLGVLYNLELATMTLFFATIVIFMWGIGKKTIWMQKTMNRKIISISVLLFLLPMLPILIYDFTHGFPQTFKFAAWIGYHFIQLVGIIPHHGINTPTSWDDVITFSAHELQLLIFAKNALIALLIFLASGWYFLKVLRHQQQIKKFQVGTALLGILLLFTLAGFVSSKTTSDAYLFVMFPLIILMMAISFDALWLQVTSNTSQRVKRPWRDIHQEFGLKKVVLIAALLYISWSNISALLANNYYITYAYSDRLGTVKKMIADAHGRSYILKAIGGLSSYPSFTMNYQYLAWWMGNEPASKPQHLLFTLTETSDNKIYLEQTCTK